MTWRTLGFGLTVLAAVLALVVAYFDRPDWWAGPVVFGVMLILYWSLAPLLFDTDADEASSGSKTD